MTVADNSKYSYLPTLTDTTRHPSFFWASRNSVSLLVVDHMSWFDTEVYQ